jgi:hypothetical protein
MDTALALASWLKQRWWGKPFGWLIWGITWAVVGGLLVGGILLLLAAVGAVLFGIGLAVAESRTVPAALFCSTVVLLVCSGVVLWREDHWDGVEGRRGGIEFGSLRF